MSHRETVVEHSFGDSEHSAAELRLERRNGMDVCYWKREAWLKFDYCMLPGLTAHIDLKLASSPAQMRQLAEWLLDMADRSTPGLVTDPVYPFHEVEEE